jgi:hypothetical protein
VQTSHIPAYEAKLQAEFDTWLGALPAEERIVIGPKCDKGVHCEEALWDESICQDNSQWCKAAASLDRAFQEKDFDWLVQLYEDDYVNTDLLKKKLASVNASVPAVYSGFGCAREAHFTKQQLADLRICPAVLEKGGLCGGNGIIFSRAAVDRLFADGREAFWRRVYSYPSTIQCDIATSCLLYDASVPMGLDLDGRQAFLMPMTESPESHLDDPCFAKSFFIYHLAGTDGAEIGDFMRRLHRARPNDSANC